MRSTKWILSLLCFARLAAGAVSGAVPVPNISLFVPQGFDDNDEVVVTLDGYLPNACYQLTEAVVTRDLTNHRILVQQMAYVSPGPCVQVLSPYVNTVRIGQLPVGSYMIASASGSLRKTLNITRAPIPTKDDYLYAPIDSAMVAPYQGGYVAVLTGRYTNSCLRMRAIPVRATGDTVQVFPIMEFRKADEAGRPCRKVELPFRVTQRLPALSRGRYLLHVRSLNGRSANTVFSVE